MKLPFPARTVSSGYGIRYHPATGRKMFHRGIDMRVPDRTPIRLAYPATVIALDTLPDVGHQLVVEIAPKVRVKLNHLAELPDLIPGAVVPTGERLALSGKTGTGALGAHLCLELWIDGQHVDPHTPIPKKRKDPK